MENSKLSNSRVAYTYVYDIRTVGLATRVYLARYILQIIFIHCNTNARWRELFLCFFFRKLILIFISEKTYSINA
jgi:hypothetical protein